MVQAGVHAAAERGMESFLQFDAASRMATVWLNGTLLGSHKGGFSRFRLNSTAALKPGQKNVLTVRVDNAKPALGSSTADILPLTGDFFVYGGLYRPVTLVFTSKMHLDLMDYGSAGVYANTSSLGSAGAEVQVRARVRNDGEQSGPSFSAPGSSTLRAKPRHTRSNPSPWHRQAWKNAP